VYVGDKKITDPNYRLQSEDFDSNGRAMLRVGAKKRATLTHL